MNCLMNINILLSFLFFLGFGPNLLFTQVKGKLLNTENLEPIGYAVISWNGGSKGVISNEKGEFEITAQVVDSFIKISAMVFQDTSINLKVLKNQENTIYLRRQTFDLPTVEIKSGIPTRKKFDVSSEKYTCIGSGTSGFNFSVGTEFNNSHFGFIETVSIFFNHHGRRAQGNKVMRLRVLGFNDDNYPEFDLLTEFVKLNPRRKNRWFTIDLSKFNVPLNNSNFLVAIEFIKDPDLEDDNDQSSILSGWSVGLSEIPSDQKGLLQMWDKLDGGKWDRAPNYPIQNVVPMIKVSSKVYGP